MQNFNSFAEARLKENGEVLKKIPTVQRQIAYLKGRIPKRSQDEKKIILMRRLSNAHNFFFIINISNLNLFFISLNHQFQTF